METRKATPDQDAFGRALQDYLDEGSGFEVIERDDGYVESVSMSESVYFAAFEEWPIHEQDAMAFVGGKVLDVGCGAGRVALHVQSMGHEVTAIDVSPLAVRVSKRLGVKSVKRM